MGTAAGTRAVLQLVKIARELRLDRVVDAGSFWRL